MDIIKELMDAGAHKVGEVPVKDIPLNADFRAICEMNQCGKFGRCWTCPPFVGDIHEMMAEVGTYDKAIVYQTVSEIEDSFDIEGMLEAGEVHNAIAQDISKKLREEYADNQFLHLGAGGCKVCERCSKEEDKPCRFPHLAMKSLEAYGVDVGELSPLADMKYINGQNTVTYFGMILLK